MTRGLGGEILASASVGRRWEYSVARLLECVRVGGCQRSFLAHFAPPGARA